jgi:peptidoglycan/LPS O-acetylase OafA/YrhL
LERTIDVKEPKHEFAIPSLDGLRAVAILLVLVAHAGLGDLVPGGFGVTVFFFLSGYLICTLLRREWEKNRHINLGNFYLRRLFRIFPPMYLVLILGTAYALAGGFQEQITWAATMAQAFHFTNYYVIYSGVGLVPGLGIFWSLAIEEHFYLIFPLSLPFLLRNYTASRQAIILSIVCLLILLWRIVLVYGYHVNDVRTYYGTDTRLDAILWGCVLALFHNPKLDAPKQLSTKAIYGMFLGAVAILIASLLFRDPMFRETYRYTMQSVALFPIFYIAVAEYRRFPFTLLNRSWIQYSAFYSASGD